MVVLFGTIVWLLILLIVYRKLNNNYQEQKFRCRLYQIRDELRNLAIEGKVNINSEEFEYLDFSISKLIRKSYLLTLFYLFALEIKHGKNKSELEHYRNTYYSLLEKIRVNKYLCIIDDKRNQILRDYIIDQNKITFFIAKYLFSILLGINGIKRIIAQKIAYSNYLPEISGIS